MNCGQGEVSHHLDVEPEKTAVVRGQCDLQLGIVSVLRHSPSQQGNLCQLPLPSGLSLDPEVRPAAALWSQDPLNNADGLPPALWAPEFHKDLAFHQELRQSICSNFQVNKSLLEL
ncbi:hypothetical protein MC885_007512 [Smutsia gigantea]|nr:hypothetical protein MC885_007512 [Smutsia gigantea]